MLMKPADLDAAFAFHQARLQRQRAGHHLGEGRFARAVDAKEPDTVVDVEPQVEIAQHRRAVVADRGGLKLEQRRRQRPRRRGDGERRHPLLDHFRHRLELGEALDARLRLRRLAGLGAEPVDELLQMRALGVLLGPRRRQQPGLFRAALLEVVVAAGIKFELAFAQMQNGVDRIVEKLAVVADDQRGMRIFLQPRFEPERAFEVEIVGRLVEQQQIGLARTKPPRAPRACASRRRIPPSGGRDRRWRSRARRGFPPPAPARCRRRSRSAAGRFRQALRVRRFPAWRSRHRARRRLREWCRSGRPALPDAPGRPSRSGPPSAG